MTLFAKPMLLGNQVVDALHDIVIVHVGPPLRVSCSRGDEHPHDDRANLASPLRSPDETLSGAKADGTIAAINGERAVDESFGALLRRHRLAASLTQEALAERAAVSATAIAALERGRRRAPRLSTLRLIARALDLSAGDLAELSRAASAEVDAGVSPPDNRSETSEQPSPDDPVPPPTRSGGEGGLPLPKVIVRRWRTGFVGRGKELAELDRAWEDRRRLVLVGGDAGIGKTRLVTEFAERRARDGVTVAWGRCSEEGLGAYLPFVEVARQLARHRGSLPTGPGRRRTRGAHAARARDRHLTRSSPVPHPSRVGH